MAGDQHDAADTRDAADRDGDGNRGASSWRPGTLAVTGGRAHTPGAPLTAPLVATSAFVDGGRLGYARDGNPTWEAFESTLAALEGAADAVAFASGQAATAAVVRAAIPGGLPRGAVVLGPAVGYLGTRALLRDLDARGEIDLTLLDITDTAATCAALAARPARLVWLESPTNPLLDLADLAALAAAAHAADPAAVVVVDNTFATPLGQQPLALGADIVVHSATKFLGGHSDLLLGVVATATAEAATRIRVQRHDEGATPGVLESWLALRGLRTLEVRLARSSAGAAELAGRLAGHPAVTRVRYPGTGGLLAFETASRARSEALLAALRLVVPATSLGGVESTLDLRIRWPGEEAVPPGLLRMSVGLEHVEDLWADLSQALGGLDART
jgi:cystathionine gamma-synthase